MHTYAQTNIHPHAHIQPRQHTHTETVINETVHTLSYDNNPWLILPPVVLASRDSLVRFEWSGARILIGRVHSESER